MDGAHTASSWARPLMAALGLASQACAYRVPTPEAPDAVPAVSQADLEGATVTIQDRTGALDADALAEVRAHAADFLDVALDSDRGDHDVDVRVAIEVTERVNYADRALAQDGIAIVGLFPALFGMIIDHEAVTAEVEIEKDGLVYKGRGVAALDGSLFAPARKRALALAMHRALDAVTVESRDEM